MPTLTRLKTAIWAGVFFFSLAVLSVGAFQALNARNAALEDSTQRTTQFVAGAEAALNRALLAIDVLLASTDEMLGLSVQGARLPTMDWTAASHRLRSSARQNLMVRYVALLDTGGRVLASSDPAGGTQTIELPTGYLQQVLQQPVSMLVISPPVVSFASAERVLYVARHLRVADGQRLVALAELPVSALSAVIIQGVDISGLQVTLERAAGQVLLSVPGREDAAPTTVTPALAVIEAAGSRWQAPARLTGEPALVLSRPVLYQDLRIVASLPLEAALADWRSDRNGIVAVVAVFLVLLLLAGGLAVRYLDRITQARQDMARAKATLDQALESMDSGFLLLDAQWRVVQWNRRFEEIFPWLKEVMAPMEPFQTVLLATVHQHLPQASAAEQRGWVERRMALMQMPQGPHEQHLPTGMIVQITEQSTPEGGLVISYHDVTALRQASAEIENLAFYDPLTNLPNRRLLMDRMQQAIDASTRSGKYGALLFLDLDHFKVLNDTLGHEVGDVLLQQVAQRLRGCVRGEDTVARLGGDEFVVMLRDLSPIASEAAATARRVGEKILRRLNQPYRLHHHTYHSTPSIGATLLGCDMPSSNDLLKQADIAMYQVKSQGRNALCFFDPKMQIAISQRAQLESDLQVALTGRQFELHYQPQFRLDGHMVGAEALIRWCHPVRGLVPPGAFIAVAEESELIVPIGHWVMQTACEQLALWQNDPVLGQLQLSVNVSARQFRQRDFVARVVEILRATGARSHLLKLELTESLVLDDVEDTVAKMVELKTKGVRFSVDDFGTGYSSLAYLTRLPLDQLKIDQSFVHNIGLKHTDDVIVQTIIGMARNLQLDVIAEGVETPAQREFLAEHGCDLLQGYLMGRPMPVAELEAAAQAPSAA